MERWWWNRERQRPLKPRNRSIPWLLFKRCTCGAEIESSLHTFRYGNILNPYSKAVPAIIAKASAIYNPFIYAITHGNYRWAPQTNYATLKKNICTLTRVLISTGTPSQQKSPVCISWSSRPEETACPCLTAIRPSGTRCWADSRLFPKPSFTEFPPCLRQTLWVCFPKTSARSVVGDQEYKNKKSF